MKTKVKILFSMATVLMLLVGITGVALADVHTDLQVYSAGDTVSITGDGMNGGESVGIDVAFPDGSLAQHQDVMADDAGNFADSYVLPSDAPGGIYTVTATGADSGNSFSTTFDPPAKANLNCLLPTYNPTHYGIMPGQTVTCTITNAILVGSPSTVDVIIQSSAFGNETVTGTVSGTTITFTYTGHSAGCDTTDVKYDDGSGHTKDVDKGFAFVDANGGLLACGGTTPDDLTVTKTAGTSFTRTYGWTIEKSAKAATIVPYLATGYKYQIVSHGDGLGFEQPSFDDSAFGIGDAGFGTDGYGCGLNETDVKTNWPLDTDILVRKEFVLPTGVTGMKISIGVAIDNDVQVFVNGSDVSGGLQTHEGCPNLDSFVFTVPDGVLHGGINLIAVRGVDRGVLSYLDLQMTSDNIVYSTGGGESGPATFTVAVTKDAGTDSDFAVSGSIFVYNPNSFAIDVTGVSDSLAGASVDCGVSFPHSLAGLGTLTCPYSASVADASGGTNTATATWDSKSASGTADYAFGDPTTVVNDEIDVTDSNGKSWHFTGSDSKTYSMTYTDPAGTCTEHVNTATITQTGASASATVTDCQGADLTVSKTAAPSFDLTYAWQIDKSVDKTSVKQVGGNATFNYTVAVSHNAGTESNWKVTGQITVSNPNDWEDITADVSDAIPGGTCSVTNGTGVSVPASGYVTLDYSCTFGSNPGSGTNTATATWDGSAAHTLNSSAQGTADFAFGAPTNVFDDCVTVTDSFKGALGTACVGDANPKTFTYQRVIPVTAGCHSYDNTATFTTNDTHTQDSDSQTVEVCGPAQTGALTIGFWKTTNGQNLIKTYCANTLDDFLAGLGSGSGPFADALGKNCTQLNTYVQGILNGASATNMNVMLKAQMMGTALDVWFSGPGWTSTQIGSVKTPSKFLSHNNLGTFNMDTTAVCPMVDNTSTGTATCLNNLPSTDAVASGAVPTSPMSMQAILNYAATTPSPFNGSTSSSVWYGGNRTKQEILKNIFDQFNNQMAFGSF